MGVHELDSSSPWIKQAPAENAAWKDALKDFGSVTKAKAVGARTAEEEEAENVGRGWCWKQTDSGVEVTVTVPEGTTKKGLQVATGRLFLRVALNDSLASPLVDIKLYAPVSVDESTWTIGADARGPHVQVTMEKEEEQMWPLIEPKDK